MRNTSRSFAVTVIALSVIAALLASCSLAAPAPSQQRGPIGSVGPSQPVGQQPPAQPAQPLQLPSRRPSAASGAAFYAEKCAPCHGLQGRGNGQQAAQIQQQFGKPVADLASDVIARAQTPAQWFDVLSNGRLQNGMPPFGGKYDANQLWDVIVYVWSLSADIERGQTVYAVQCAHCHGDKGKGDGKDAQGQLLDLSDFAAMAKVEAGTWDQALASTHVPSFAGTLSESERRAAIDYVRTLSYDFSTSAPLLASTPSSASTGSTTPPTASGGLNAPITVQGHIVNGTAGQPVPGNSPITFYIFPGGTGNTQITQTLQADAQGRFTLTTTRAATGDLLAATTDYNDLSFFSNLEQVAPQVTLPITIYEHTPDATNLKIETMHIVVIPGQNGLDVSEIYVLSNSGDRMVAGFGQPIMHFSLPAGATQLSVDPGMRPDTLVPGGDGLDYYDAVPVGRGTAQIIFQYALSGPDYKLDRPILHNVGSVNLLVGGEVSQTTVSGDQLTAMGMLTQQGQAYQQFRVGNLTPGKTLSIQIGAPNASSNPGSSPPNLLPIVLGVLLIVGGGVGIFMWQRGRMSPAASSAAIQREALIDVIAALDDDFDAGKIDEINYKAKRARLKEKLIKLLSTV